MNPVLTFDQVSKRYGAKLALDQLSLGVEPGEIVGFLGPNGAGKTTALHLALGFLRPSSGRGEMFGRPFGDATARRRLGSSRTSPSSSQAMRRLLSPSPQPSAGPALRVQPSGRH